MGIYAEKRDKLVARIEELTKRIATDTAKKQELEEKLKEANRLAMAEQFNCKPRELDDIINSEHTLLQKLRASGLSDSELLELVGSPADDNGNAEEGDNADSSDGNADDDSADDDDDIKFYDEQNSDDGDDRDDESA
ncbi:MAG: hypothetical protein J6B01_12260 [Ruminococcus sp.]|nr:hypothetical protein [Ruminococcus sp.]